MVNTIIIILLIFARLIRGVQKAFSEVPSRELRRRAAKNDERAHRLYQAGRYNGRLKFFLESLIAITLAVVFCLTFSSLEPVWAITAVVLIIFYFFIYSPASQIHPASRKLAETVSPILSSVMKFINPVVYVIKPANFGEKIHEPFFDHTDLIDFLNWQAKVEGSRISKESIQRAIEALEHREVLVKDIMTAKKSMVFLRPDEKVGPILLSELHKSGQEYFAVKKVKGEIEGLASLNGLTKLKEGGTVSDATKKRVAYLNYDDTLPEAAGAFLSTKEKAYLVLDKKGEVSGIVKFSSILENLAGLNEEHLQKDYYQAEKPAQSNS